MRKWCILQRHLHLARPVTRTRSSMTNDAPDPLRRVTGDISKPPHGARRSLHERVSHVESITGMTSNAYTGIRTDLKCASARADFRYRRVSRELEELHQRVDESFEYLERLERNLRVYAVIEEWARSTDLGHCCPAVRRLRDAINDILPLAFALPEAMGDQDVVMQDDAGDNAGDNA